MQEDDTEQIYPLKLFVKGASYKLLGLIPAEHHLYGVADPRTAFLLGTDRLGRDMFSRIRVNKVETQPQLGRPGPSAQPGHRPRAQWGMGAGLSNQAGVARGGPQAHSGVGSGRHQPVQQVAVGLSPSARGFLGRHRLPGRRTGTPTMDHTHRQAGHPVPHGGGVQG